VAHHRPACARSSTFLWLTVGLAALGLCPDLVGSTSLVRALELSGAIYHCLPHIFHSNTLRLDALTVLWRQTVERRLARRLAGDKFTIFCPPETMGAFVTVCHSPESMLGQLCKW
jgi:hypothetical protein